MAPKLDEALSMIAEIESILKADDAAGDEVETARAEAERFKTLARGQAE
jgi:hypothetical protein